jgi:hypothetical protein
MDGTAALNLGDIGLNLSQQSRDVDYKKTNFSVTPASAGT